jgi:hypothetical protein
LASAKKERARATKRGAKGVRQARDVGAGAVAARDPGPSLHAGRRDEVARAERATEPELRDLSEDALREMRDAPRGAGDPLVPFGTPEGALTTATSRAATSPELAGGDVDAAAAETGTGEEAVGGSTPTPDQDVVEEIGRAAGLTYQDDEPLRSAQEKVERRDDDRWELNPASAEDFAERRNFSHALPEKRRGRGR